MLRNLLEDRFSLKAHFETKESPLFILELARQDGTLGPGLRRRTPDAPSTGDGRRGAPLLSSDADAPSFFTALREQLGLKLEPTRGPVDILVIERIEQPAPN